MSGLSSTILTPELEEDSIEPYDDDTDSFKSPQL